MVYHAYMHIYIYIHYCPFVRVPMVQVFSIPAPSGTDSRLSLKTRQFDSTSCFEGNSSQHLVLSNRRLQAWKSQRFDSTEFSETKPFGNKLMLSNCCLQVWKKQRFDSTKVLNGHSSENLVLSNRPSMSLFQRFDSAEVMKRHPSNRCLKV